jgi:hypothetical protein
LEPIPVYERLGHLSVYTRESDQPNTPREARQKEFFETARGYLERGVNLIIAPEGTSRSTEESPGEFRPGAFRLALSLAKEPLIVPVAVANFYRRLNHTALGLVVKRPFRVSDRVRNADDPLALRRFLLRLQGRYRGYVREARAAADSCWQRRPSQGARSQLELALGEPGIVAPLGFASGVEEELLADLGAASGRPQSQAVAELGSARPQTL